MSDETRSKPMTPAPPRPLRLFEAFGIELEYMIVDAERLDVMPVCDRVMRAEAGEPASSIDFDDIGWSNELVLHVLEFKTASPVATLDGLCERFEHHIAIAQRHLDAIGGRLLPTAMHPWMDPQSQTKLWPHEYGPVYEAFDRIFGCKGHGWANLQSMHINLPFADDDEFGRLHAAIRLVLPIIPAIAASSPYVDGRATGMLDNRLDAYRRNCRRIPLVSGAVIPEAVFSIDDYHARILRPMYESIAPHDPDGILQHEWLNARGAIARFDRGAIEIRVIDSQECPRMDLAVARLVIGVVRALVDESLSSYEAQRAMSVDELAGLFERTIATGEKTGIVDDAYLRTMGVESTEDMTTGALWRILADRLREGDADVFGDGVDDVDLLLERGPLARMLLREAGDEPSHDVLRDLYRRLADGLTTGEPFV